MKHKPITILVTEKEHAEFKRYCRKQGKPITTVGRALLRYGMSKSLQVNYELNVKVPHEISASN